MWSKVERYIEKYKLLKSSELYLVALSGGADSVALLLLLKNAHFNVHAAHCNFHLRGEESDRDEAFCVELCKGLGVELHRAHFDTREYAELHKVSIEMAARELRYKWFEQLREDIGAAGICVAHHRDDSVETVLCGNGTVEPSQRYWIAWFDGYSTTKRPYFTTTFVCFEGGNRGVSG